MRGLAMLKTVSRVAAALALLSAACSFPAAGQQPPVPDQPARISPLDEDAPPPLTDGIYIGYGACPGEGCSIAGHIRAASDGTLVDGPVGGAAVIGVIKALEWVEVLDTQERLIPVRGVLRREVQGLDGLKPGDVVYMLGYEGEGCSTLYRRGQEYSWCDQGLPEDSDEREIEWDFTDPPQELLDRTGFFIQVRRADGQEGWLGAGDFQCIGAIDATRDCPWFNNAEEAAAWSPPNDIDQYWGHEGSEPNPWLLDGLYSERVFCPGQDCYLGGSIRAKESVGLVGVDEQGAPVVDTLPAGEWVWILGWEHRVRATPGVVRVEQGDLKVGDRVFSLGRPTPDCAVIFHGYFRKTLMCAAGGGQPGADVIDWGDSEPFDAKRAGLWVMVKRRSSGTPLYVREADIGKFACVTLNNRDADCPPVKTPATVAYYDPASEEDPT